VDTEEVSAGAVSRYLGLLAAAARRIDRAASHLEDALALNQRMSARPWTARTQYDYAHLLFARNKAEDSHRARELLDQALATYRELHIRPYRLQVSATSSADSQA